METIYVYTCQLDILYVNMTTCYTPFNDQYHTCLKNNHHLSKNINGCKLQNNLKSHLIEGEDNRSYLEASLFSFLFSIQIHIQIWKNSKSYLPLFFFPWNSHLIQTPNAQNIHNHMSFWNLRLKFELSLLSNKEAALC